MTYIFIIAKLVILKSSQMKKLFIVVGFLFLTSCATSNSVAYESNFSSCGVSDCEIASIHNHMWLD